MTKENKSFNDLDIYTANEEIHVGAKTETIHS